MNSPSIAVFIRCHKFSLKLIHLYCELMGGLGYDLYLMSDETNGYHDYGSAQRVSFKLSDLDKYNINPKWPGAVMHYGDLMLSVFREMKPTYSHYIMLEFDVYFSHLGRAWLEVLCHTISTSKEPIDLIAPQIGPAPADWVWHAVAADYFPAVYGSFFPVVIASKRAIRCNEVERKREADQKLAGSEPIFCEAFLPSAVHAAGQRLMNLNDLMPGSYDLSSFNAKLPAPFVPDKNTKACRLIHPIKSMKDAPLLAEDMAKVIQTEPEGSGVVSVESAYLTAIQLVSTGAAFRGLAQALIDA